MNKKFFITFPSLFFLLSTLSLMTESTCLANETLNNVSSGSTINGGVGHSLKLYEVESTAIPSYLQSDLKLTINGKPTSRRKHIITHDFTGDGVPDKVVCRIKHHDDSGVEIYDGVTGDQKFSYTVPPYTGGTVNQKRRFTDCHVTELEPGRPAIFYAAARFAPTGKLRENDYQRFHYLNDKGGFTHALVQTRIGTNYQANARNVKCIPYPQNLVDKGYKPGILCFWAGYDCHTSDGYGTQTAIVKIEYNGGNIVYKDLSASSGTPWIGGTTGTGMHRLPYYDNSYQYLYVLDGAFIDYDRDGYPDLMMGAAHSDHAIFKMVYDSSRSEGVRFKKTVLSKSSYIYDIQTFMETEPSLDSTCLYISDGKAVNGRQDHILCYQNGRWVRQELPGNNFLAGDTGINVLKDKNGNRLYIHVGDTNNDGLSRTFKLQLKKPKYRFPSSLLFY